MQSVTCLIWTDLAKHPVGPMLGKLSFSHLYWSRGREEFPYWAVTGQSGIPLQPGWKYQQQDVVFVRGQFPVLGPYKHTAHPSDVLSPFLFWLTLSPFLFCHLFVPSLFSLCTTSPRSISGTSQLSPMTLANQREASGLMRLLGLAFPGEKDKREWETQQEEARRRDHRRIGTVGGKI